MKRSKILSLILALVMALSTMSCLTVVGSAAVVAEDGVYDELGVLIEAYWQLDDEGVLTIKEDCAATWGSYAGLIKKVVLEPGVTKIPSSAFAGYPLLESIDFTNNSLAIGAGAFQRCPNLKEVRLGYVSSMGDYAMYDCDSLTAVYIGGGIPVGTAGSNILKGCDALEYVWLGNGTREIGYGMFEDCTALETVVVPDSVVEIGAHAFENCVSLTEITVPDSTTTVGAYAFYNCVSAKSLYIGHKAETIGAYAFGNNTSLETVEIASAMPAISKGMFYGCTALTSLVNLPDGIENIGEVAFKGCSALTEITIPSTVINIGSSAFDGTAITTINIPWNVNEIGAGAFTNCMALTAINVDATNSVYKSVDGILYSADLSELISCPAGKSGDIVVDEACETIGASAFLGCLSVTSVEIPASVTEIDVTAFNDCSDSLVIKSLCNVYAAEYAARFGIDTEFTHIGETEWVVISEPTCEVPGSREQKCSGCEFVFTTEAIDPIGHKYDNGVVTTPATCEADGVMTYTCLNDGCTHTYTAPVPATGHSYDEGTVILEPTCDVEGTRRFSCKNDGCEAYYDVAIPATGHSFDDGTVTIEATCTTDGVKEYKCTDTGCGYTYTEVIPATGHKLSKAEETLAPKCEVPGESTRVCENEGCEHTVVTPIPATGHTYDDGVITKYPTIYADGEITFTCENEWCTEDDLNHTYTVPFTTTAFDGLIATNKEAYADENGNIQNLTWFVDDEYNLVIFADGTEGEWDIYKHDIVTVSFVGKRTVAPYAFQQCEKLESVAGYILNAGEYAFYGCYALEFVHIQGGLESVGQNVFKDCNALKSVVFDNGTLNVGYGMFENCDALETIKLPDSLLTIGELAFEDCTALTVIEVPDSVTSVGRYAFHNCSAVKFAYIGHNAEDIGEYAFCGCSELEIVEIASAMRKLSVGMFMDCTSLIALDIEEGVEEIGKNAFKGCTAFSLIELPTTLKTIGDSAFDGTALTVINIPADVENIAKGAFTGCDSLADINVDIKNDYYYSYNGVLYDIEVKKLLACPAGKTGSYEIKDGTQEITEDAFIGCDGLTEVQIPASVTTIAENAFFGCDSALVFKTNCDNVAVAYAEKYGFALDVTHSEETVVIETVAPTCTTDGEKATTCAACDHVISTATVPALGHEYDNGVVTKKATCEEDGVVTISCTREGCSESYTEVIPATNHSYDEGKVVLEPTCEDTGIKRFTCQHEGCYDYYEISLKALGHAYDKGVVTTPATCEADGVMTYSCTREGCSESYTEVIPATGHAYDSGVVTTEATCEADGVMTFTCANCGDTYTEVIPAIGHNYVEAVVKPATCKEPGLNSFTCTNCGDSYTVETIGEHKPYSTPIKVEATCEEDGHEGTLCSICNQFIGEYTTTPATGHTYEDGYCVDCGAVDEEYMNAVPDTPDVKTAKNTKYGIKVTWAEVEGAKYYEVLRKEDGKTNWVKVGSTEKTYFTDKDMETGTTWRYSVRAVGENGNKSGNESGIKVTSVETPKLKSVINLKNGIRVRWNKVDEAKSYRVYRKLGSGSWKYLGTVKTTQFIDKTAKTGKMYTYTVKAVNGSYSGHENGLKLKRVDAPELLKATNTKNGIKVTWGEVSNAKTYRVYRREAGATNWTYIGKTTREYYVDKAVKNKYGKKYTYTVRAIDGEYKSDYNAGVTAKRTK